MGPRQFRTPQVQIQRGAFPGQLARFVPLRCQALRDLDVDRDGLVPATAQAMKLQHVQRVSDQFQTGHVNVENRFPRRRRASVGGARIAEVEPVQQLLEPLGCHIDRVPVVDQPWQGPFLLVQHLAHLAKRSQRHPLGRVGREGQPLQSERALQGGAGRHQLRAVAQPPFGMRTAALVVDALRLDHPIAARQGQQQRIGHAAVGAGMVAVQVRAVGLEQDQPGALRRSPRERNQALDDRIEIGHRAEPAHRFDALKQQRERCIRLAPAELDVGRLDEGLARFTAPAGAPRQARRGQQLRQGRERVAGLQPVVRQPGRWRAARRNEVGHTRVDHAPDRLRQQAHRGFEHQVVGKAVFVEDGLTFEQGPGIGQFEHIAPAHGLRQFGAEVTAGDGGDAHQQQALGGQRGEPVFEQVEHLRRGVQAVGAQPAVVLERAPDRLQQVQRVAADAPR